MIKLNTPYTIENGDVVTFAEGKKGSITGTYGDGTITGTLDGNLLKSTFHNTKANAVGLMEITFHENGFDAKWKSGLEPGPMRGKWEGKLGNDIKNISSSIEAQNVLFQLEINSIEEYGINYGSFSIELNIESKLVDDFRNDCNYDSIVSLISAALNTNVSEILRCAAVSIDLEELKLDDYDWWSYSPCIRVLKIDNLDLSPIYKVYKDEDEYNSDAADLLKKEEDEIYDYVSDFMSDIAFHFEKDIFFDSI
jgi:hypothetical protein